MLDLHRPPLYPELLALALRRGGKLPDGVLIYEGLRDAICSAQSYSEQGLRQGEPGRALLSPVSDRRREGTLAP